MSVLIVATVTPKPERRDAVRAALLAAVPAVHEEPGCERYTLQEDKRGFVFIEQWASREAMGVHGEGENFTAMLAAITDDLAEPLGVRVLTPLPVGDPDKGSL
ncbi:Quinol monooxygenase YgiN [Modestobacter sp. DSM 44400]|uniref:putative quinol monooxygenase n=1 Tax=Modestobacter sp. DSM 44400 TaxID=1550230 RepID=UPI0008959DA0|nr:antibiotic biosynthesis monooxygenase [Modestobacter sp. DSM 44400]SDX72953.1 Quinol monooxygenase YgiN [Modestobacter sp. DSM 44400]